MGVIYELLFANLCKTLCTYLDECSPLCESRGEGKAIPAQPWTGPGGCKKLRPQILRQLAHEGGTVVSPMHWPPLPPQDIYPVLISVRG